MSNQSLMDPGTAPCLPTADDVFGPVVSGCRQNFDFTLLFEQSILTLVPAALLLLVAPLRLLQLYKASVKTRPASVGQVKLATAVVLVALQLALVVLWNVNRPLQTRVSVPCAIIGLIAALLVLFLSYVEHARSVRPSSLLNIYLLLTLTFDIAQARTLFLRSNISIASVFVATMAAKLLLLLLEVRSKRAFLKNPYDQLPTESTSGIFNRSYFWWLNPLFIRAFRSLLSFEDLPEIDVDLSSIRLGKLFQQAWAKRSKPESRFTLVFVSNRALFRPLLAIIFPRIFLIGFNFAQPFLITSVLNFLIDPPSTSAESQAYGLIAATGLIYMGIAMSTVHFQHALYRYMTMFRGAMITAIFSKTLSLKCDEYNESTALTLMSTDIDRIVLCFEYFHSVWARFIEVVIGTTLLALQMGWVCVIPIVVIGLSSLGSTLVAKMIGNRQKIWVEAIQRRIAITSSMLESMKSIKMMGLTETVSATIQSQRIRETEHQAGYRWMSVWLNAIAEIPGCLAPVATFAAFAIQAQVTGSEGLNITQAFTSLSIITLTTGPAEALLAAIPGTASSLGCFDRIQKFLLAPLYEDKRILMGKIQALSSRSASELEILNEGIELSERHTGRVPSLDSSAFLIEDATIRPSPNASPILKNVNFNVDRGSILMIAGPVGSGKTTLLKALLGELDCDSGSISVISKRSSYCAQSSWLSNCSIQQNICGPAGKTGAIDEAWYQAVIRACALDVDISILADGDRTIIGSKGVTLSGGQKQRVALARALYARHELFILDDVFSALDGSTERIVSERTFGKNGLLRKLGSTVILVTHTTRYFSFSDQIVILGANGHIAQRGTYHELRQKDGFIKSILLHPVPSSDESSQDTKAMNSDTKTSTKEATVKDQAQDLARRTGDMAVYAYYMKSVGWPKAMVFAGFAALAVFASSFSQVWLNWWVNAGGDQVGKNVSVYAFLSLMQIFCRGACYWAILVVIAPSTARKLHHILLKTVMGAPQSFFDNTDTGTTLNRFSQDMTLVETSLALGVLFTVFNAFMAISQAGLIASGSYYMVATLPLFLLGIFILQKVYLRTSRQLQFLDLEARSPLYSHFLETLDGLVTLRAFGWQEQYKDMNIKHVDYSQRPYYLLYCIQRWLNLVLDLIVAAMGILVVALALNLRKSVSAGLLGIALNNVLAFTTSLQPLVTGWTLLETSLGAVARLRNFEAETEQENKPNENLEPPSNWPQCGEIVFRNLTVSYGSATPVLRDISLTILPGQKVGICGRTGSGKSTLLSTLLRLIDPISGDILIDDLSLLSLPRAIIRTRLLTTPQDPLLLTGSVRLNVDPMDRYSDAAIISALEKVQLWPSPLATRSATTGDADGNEFNGADRSPDIIALDAPLHENPLSTGQAQLLALARALLRKDECKIVLLDEATSSVDAETDKVVQAVLRAEFHGHTIVSVAHRLETVMDADQVVVLDQGRVVEVGEPGALLRGEEGIGAFRNLAGR